MALVLYPPNLLEIISNLCLNYSFTLQWCPGFELFLHLSHIAQLGTYNINCWEIFLFFSHVQFIPNFPYHLGT